MTETDDAYRALTDAGIDSDTAIKALLALHEAGFLIRRPQALLDHLFDNLDAAK